ncbi:MAG: endo-1,4-beta-xylanase [Halanaerobium sp.]
MYLNTKNLFILFILLVLLVFASSAAAETVYETNFEAGSGNWSPRGDGVNLKIVDSEAAAGSQSLFIEGRSEDWHSPALDIQSFVEGNEEYNFSLKVKLVEGAENSTITLSTENSKDGENSWDNVGSVKAKADEWTELNADYTIKPDMDRITLYAESPETELEFYIDDVVIAKEGEVVQQMEEDIPSLAETYEEYFKIGAAVEPYQLEGEHAGVLKKHFNSLTAENVMKPETIQPEEGEFNFSEGDKIRDFTKENEMVMRGHTLVWHSQVPDWFFEDEEGELVEKEILLDRMRNHIEKTMEHYQGDVDSWDVVNEAIDPSADETDGLRNSKWYQIAGIDYIKEAFIHANKIDPEAKLYINDYSLLSDPEKRDIMHRVVKELLEEDIPVDGIGMQGHINIESPTISAMEKTLEKFASLDVELQITELDLSVYTNDSQSYDDFEEELAVKQGHRYREIFNLFKQYSDQITNVTLWGIGDDHTWLTDFPVERNNWPLLFDQQLKAKPAFWGVVDPDRLPVITKEFDIHQGSPEIDAESDSIWQNTGSTLDLEENEYLGGEIKLSWDEDTIYLYALIEDQSQNEEDSIEIFIDETNSKNDDEADIKDYQIARSGESSIKAEVVEKEGGYLVEAAVPVESRSLSVGDQIGFDLKISDQESETSIIWNDFSRSQAESVENYGTLNLIEAPVTTEAVKGSPEIDAEMDESWQEANTIKTEKRISGENPAAAEVKTMWDEDYLYLYAEVTDSALSLTGEQAHEEDSVEIFVDENNDKASEYQSDDTQYRINYLNQQSFNPQREGLKSATRVTETGYVVEAAVPLVEITAEAGQIIGFDFQVNDDSNGDGSRDGVSIWNDESGEGWRDMSGLGNLIFVE